MKIDFFNSTVCLRMGRSEMSTSGNALKWHFTVKRWYGYRKYCYIHTLCAFGRTADRAVTAQL